MSDEFFNGIGFASDLEQQEITASGYPVVNPGYFYIDNTEYYIFASGVSVALDGGIITAAEYIAGKPYFILDSKEDISVTTEGFKYVDTADNISASGLWEYDNEMFNFDSTGLDGKYLIYDTSETLELDKKLYESSYIVLSDVETGEPYGMDITPTLFYTAIAGQNIRFFAKVTDNNGTLLDNKSIDWKLVYEISSSGILDPSGIVYEDLISSSSTDENGITTTNITIDEYSVGASGDLIGGMADVCLYAQYGDLKSQLHWIYVVPAVPDIGYYFNTSMTDYTASLSAMCALGYDAWGEFWDAPISASGDLTSYNEIVTGQPPIVPYDSNRAEWKASHIEFKRPPLTSDDIADEAEGYWNAYDFYQAYSSSQSLVLTAPGTILWNTMSTFRVAMQGYWGQVGVLGKLIRIAASRTGAEDIIHTNLLHQINTINAANSKYTIYFNETTDVNIYGVPDAGVPYHRDLFEYKDSEFGIKGSWNDIMNSADSKYDDQLYVLYAPDYIGTDVTHMESDEFYFRGLAVMNTTTDYGEQDYIIYDLLKSRYIKGV